MIRVLARWFGRRQAPLPGPSPEAAAAVRAAQESHRRAERDLAEQQSKLPEAQRIRAALREHNEANHYAKWMTQIGIDSGGN